MLIWHHVVVRGPANTQFATAVHALTLIAGHPDRPLSAEEMAGSIDANPVHVRRVLGHLRRAGLVAARRGPGGGWTLVRPPAEIRLGDVQRAVQADGQVLGVHAANPDCPVGRSIQATLLALDRRAAAAVLAELDALTVADVLPADVRASA